MTWRLGLYRGLQGIIGLILYILHDPKQLSLGNYGTILYYGHAGSLVSRVGVGACSFGKPFRSGGGQTFWYPRCLCLGPRVVHL